MSIPKKVLCMLSLLGAAGAAGFALGRADARLPAPVSQDCDVFPRFYPTVLVPDRYCQQAELTPVDAAYPAPKAAARTPWPCLESAGPTHRYYPSPVLLVDGRVIPGGGRSIDPSPPAPPSDH